ncbi:MAG TPA: Phenylacetic acid catabolic protein, partial [Chloroflexota bacterium]|nr:Phenylacetic acid catabolic protein [Chloroflexota bacterium]
MSEEPAPPAQVVFEAAVDAEANARAVAAAAPVAQERADLAAVHTLPTQMREPMRALLASLADNKYLLGRRYAEWCTGAPKLESAVAAAAMAQDELGHARSFYPLLRGFGVTSQMEDKGWQVASTNAVAYLDRPFQHWADYIAANVVLDSAFTTLFEAAVRSPYEPLRQRAAKIVQEEQAHWVHGSGWLRRLAAQPVTQPALEAVWDHALTWFGQPDDPVLAPLAAAGLLAHGPDAQRDVLRTRLAPLLHEVGARALLDRPLPWPRWDAARRRL